MKLHPKKVNPQDVFISALTTEEQKWRAFTETDIPTEKNRPSGNEFIDLLADLISVNFMHTVSFYASKFEMEIIEFHYFMKLNSDLDFNQWRNQYILLAAKELLSRPLRTTNLTSKSNFEIILKSDFYKNPLPNI